MCQNFCLSVIFIPASKNAPFLSSKLNALIPYVIIILQDFSEQDVVATPCLTEYLGP